MHDSQSQVCINSDPEAKSVSRASRNSKKNFDWIYWQNRAFIYFIIIYYTMQKNIQTKIEEITSHPTIYWIKDHTQIILVVIAIIMVLIIAGKIDNMTGKPTPQATQMSELVEKQQHNMEII